MTPRSPRRYAWSAVAAALSLAGLAGAGCGAKSVSVCYRAIPVGKAALHERTARLVGVHLVPADRVRPHLPPDAQSELAGNNDTAVCAMEFRGHFAAGQVDRAPAGESGTYALVLVTERQLRLLASAVLNHPPRGFGGRTV